MKTDIRHQVEQERMEEYIRLHRLRNTMERKRILEYICSLKRKFTAMEVSDALKGEYISQATVYNTIQLLIKANIINALRTQSSTRLLEFELMNHEVNHITIVCSRCGRQSEVKKLELSDRVLGLHYPNFIPRHSSIFVYGICKVCRKKKNTHPKEKE